MEDFQRFQVGAAACAQRFLQTQLKEYETRLAAAEGKLAEFKKSGTCKRLVVTGCLGERYRDELKAQIPEIDAVLIAESIAEQISRRVAYRRAMKHAVIAGREAYLAGRMPKKRYADPSSPLGGLI